MKGMIANPYIRKTSPLSQRDHMHTSGKCNNDHLNYLFISKIEKNTKTSAQPHVEAHKSLYFTTAPTHTSIENCNTVCLYKLYKITDQPLLLYRQYYLLFLPMFFNSTESPNEMGRKKLMSRKGTALKTFYF